MARVTHSQNSFNGGTLSQRLRGRTDQSIYAIGVAEMVGFAPLVEGPAEAMPGTYRVAQAAGPCRLFRFEYNVTQGHVLEASDEKFRVFTNDAIVLDGDDNPLEVESPYSYAQVLALTTHQSYDVLYCFHRDVRTREFVRNGAADFAFETATFKNGPFEPRNTDKTLTVSASALTGTVTLSASDDLFAATDVGGLFKMEAEDFGDITAWEPYITVTNGQLLTWNERVYRVVGGTGRTGSLQPVHTEGVEWDGIGTGTDINSKPAAGVQLEYIHDRFGILTITGFTDAQTVTATVERHLPFSSVAGNYEYTGGYYDGWGEWVPPVEAVSYAYGTWRWSFGAFSDTRGWPECGCIWNERLILCKDSTIYASVAGDLEDFATINELGTISNDMAFTVTLPDPNPILHAVSDDKLLVINASGVFALGPSNAASGVGPQNVRADRQNDAGATRRAQPVRLDSRTLHVDRSRRRIFETDFDAQRNVESEVDLTRYARHIGKPGLVEIASQQHPHNLVWACLDDGTLAAAAYLPAEEVLGWGTRPLCDGAEARSIVTITDPQGEFEQLWIAAEFAGDWHILRTAPWRQDGDSDTTACMSDLALDYDGAPETEFAIPHLPSTTIEAVADGRFYLTLTTDGDGGFTLPVAAERVVAGKRFSAWVEGLPIEDGGENGPAWGKTARVSEARVKLVASRGIRFGTAGNDPSVGEDGRLMQALELQTGSSPVNGAFAAESTIRTIECSGSQSDVPALRVERVAPAQATLLAWGCTIEVNG